MMPTQKESNTLFCRRNFMLAALASPFIINGLLSDLKATGKGSPSTGTEAEFAILGGWVLLKSDLIENQE